MLSNPLPLSTPEVRDKYKSKDLNELLSKETKELLVEIIIRLDEINRDMPDN